MKPPEVLAVESFVAAINGHDVGALSRLMTPDHTFVDPTGRAFSGREEMTAGWRHYFQMFADYEINVEKVLAEGPIVALFGTAGGTYCGKSGPRAENRITMPAAWQARVEDGQIAVWQTYADWTEASKIMEREGANG
jgi:ketosteroid isomerase-like protein